MDEKSIPDLLSQLLPDAIEKNLDLGEKKADEQKAIITDSLKLVAGQSDASLEEAVNEFLSGKGVLHETTAAAITRGGDTGLSDLVNLLTTKFKLSPTIAKLIASLLLSLQSSSKKKPRPKPKAASSKEKETSSTKKKPKKKTPVSKKTAKKKTSSKPKPGSSQKKAKKKTPAKPKKTTAKPAAKKKPASKTGTKKIAPKTKPVKATKSGTTDNP